MPRFSPFAIYLTGLGSWFVPLGIQQVLFAWLAGIIEFIGTTIANENMINLGVAVSLLVPTDAIWRVGSYYVLSGGFGQLIGGSIPFASGAPPTPSFVVWALAYPFILLGAAALVFSRRDV